MKARALCVVAAVLGCNAAGAYAQAGQAEVTVAVFPTAAKEQGLAELAAALDPVVLAALGEIGYVQVKTRPPLDLPSTQLALDCVGETNACMRQVAEQAATESLIAPSVERVGEELVVTILYFDARGEGVLRSAARRHAGSEAERAALDAVAAMVRELYGIAEPPSEASGAPATEPYVDPGPDESAAEESSFPAVPVAVTATGVAFLAAGAAFGLMFENTKDEYTGIVIDSESRAARADAEFEKAETQALLANIGFGVGAALVATGVVMWIVELTDDGAEQAWIAPRLSPGGAGLMVSGSFGRARP